MLIVSVIINLFMAGDGIALQGLFQTCGCGCTDEPACSG